MLDSLISVLQEFRSSMPLVETTGAALGECLQNGGKVLACGNGGSASDSMHLCEELTGRYRNNRQALPAISLNADGTALTCIANDFGFEEVFSRQVEALGTEKDVLVVFSTSGCSANVIRALETAKEHHMLSIVLSGKGGGPAVELADHAIVIPSRESARIQEVHTFILHTWLEIIEEQLFGIDRSH
ncbi:D-sedoheptulose-7-phosphate isomerase [Puniceicoccus vermicola]|uniref:SIS domain-containing protein n=1 Tax=Puniceicoccus vermicola TaxID=388746 RepID=A0A7X1AYI0_9BACT|nr:SIS domain-containing protein [Puniceicoccus vermicola]MBC2602333.1 SIS domain-containing protein [Puniceicoccus vermicola]